MKKLLIAFMMMCSVMIYGQTTIPGYPQNTDPQDNDYLLGTDASTIRTNNFTLSVLSNFFGNDFATNLNTAVKVVSVPYGSGTVESRINALSLFDVGTEELCVFDVAGVDTTTYLLIPGKGTYGVGGTSISSSDLYEIGAKIDLTPYARKDVSNTFTEVNTFNNIVAFDASTYFNNQEVNNINKILMTYSSTTPPLLAFEGDESWKTFYYDKNIDVFTSNSGGFFLQSGNVTAGDNISFNYTSNGFAINASGDLNTREDSVNLNNDYSNLGITASEHQEDINTWLNLHGAFINDPEDNDIGLSASYSNLGLTTSHYQSDVNTWLNNNANNFARLNTSNAFTSSMSIAATLTMGNISDRNNISYVDYIELYRGVTLYDATSIGTPYIISYNATNGYLYNAIGGAKLLDTDNLTAGDGITLTPTTSGVEISAIGAGDVPWTPLSLSTGWTGNAYYSIIGKTVRLRFQASTSTSAQVISSALPAGAVPSIGITVPIVTTEGGVNVMRAISIDPTGGVYTFDATDIIGMNGDWSYVEYTID